MKCRMRHFIKILNLFRIHLFGNDRYHQRHLVWTFKSRIWFGYTKIQMIVSEVLFYKIVNNQSLSCLLPYTPSADTIYNTRYAANVPTIKSKQTFFENSYIPSTIIEWNKLNQNIRNAESYALFRKHILSSFRPEANSIFNVYMAKGIKLLTRIGVGFSHLKSFFPNALFLFSLKTSLKTSENINFDITFKTQ